MSTTIASNPAADPLQVQRGTLIDTIFDCSRRRAPRYALAAANIGHLGRHDRHELDVRFEGQGGHIDDPLCDVLDIHARLGRDPAGGLQPAARGVLVAGCRSVADLDLAKRIARLTGAGARRAILPWLGWVITCSAGPS
jgi:hypothetical protein